MSGKGKMNSKLEKRINEQMNAEFYSAYLYLSMSAYCQCLNLSGFANWMYVQFQEEHSHAIRIYRYLNERGGRVELGAVEKPPAEWDGIIEVFRAVCAHEEEVSELINDLVDLAIEEKDHATVSMLNWYVDEQVEEVATASDLVAQLEMIEGKGPALLMLDRELRQRHFVEEARKK